jgi:hypothetical protein
LTLICGRDARAPKEDAQLSRVFPEKVPACCWIILCV